MKYGLELTNEQKIWKEHYFERKSEHTKRPTCRLPSRGENTRILWGHNSLLLAWEKTTEPKNFKTVPGRVLKVLPSSVPLSTRSELWSTVLWVKGRGRMRAERMDWKVARFACTRHRRKVHYFGRMLLLLSNCLLSKDMSISTLRYII
jgi:hypothetical protein